jgi:hypothetical protein
LLPVSYKKRGAKNNRAALCTGFTSEQYVNKFFLGNSASNWTDAKEANSFWR